MKWIVWSGIWTHENRFNGSWDRPLNHSGIQTCLFFNEVFSSIAPKQIWTAVGGFKVPSDNRYTMGAFCFLMRLTPQIAPGGIRNRNLRITSSNDSNDLDIEVLRSIQLSYGGILIFYEVVSSNVPCQARTGDLRLIRPTLWPTELMGLV